MSTYQKYKVATWGLDFDPKFRCFRTTEATFSKATKILSQRFSSFGIRKLRLKLNKIFCKDFKGDWKGFWDNPPEMPQAKKLGLLTGLILSQCPSQHQEAARNLITAFYKNNHIRDDKMKIKILNTFCEELISNKPAQKEFIYRLISNEIAPKLGSKNKKDVATAIRGMKVFTDMLRIRSPVIISKI